MVDVRLGDVRVEVLALDKAEEEFVNDLDMRPRYFQDRLVLLRVKCLALRVHWGWDGTEQVLGEHLYDERVHFLRDDLAVVSHIVEQLVQSQALDLL